MADEEVRYKPNDNNRVLRHVLRNVWESRCYWCRKYKEYSDLEIDHILAQDSDEEERVRLKQAFNLCDEYDVHAGYNLAPICGECNKTKGSENLTQVPVVLNRLREAHKHAKTVSSRVRSSWKSSELGAALLLAAEVDFHDAGNRATFEEGAPAVMQRLSELGEDKADFFVFPIGGRRGAGADAYGWAQAERARAGGRHGPRARGRRHARGGALRPSVRPARSRR